MTLNEKLQEHNEKFPLQETSQQIQEAEFEVIPALPSEPVALTKVDISVPKELVLSDGPIADLAPGSPEHVVKNAADMAKLLMHVIAKKPKKNVVMNGRQFLGYEDWALLGRFHGVVASIVSTKYDTQTYGEIVFEAVAEVRFADSGKLVSRAEAMCSCSEDNWRGKPLYQVRSMAQTRACAKALRQVFGYIAILAGYEATPLEEIREEDLTPKPSFLDKLTKT